MPQEAFYHQPTCQLWLAGEKNLLLAWTQQPAWVTLQFTLRFIFPGLEEEDSEPAMIELHGNRADLEQLHHVVNTYIQALLAQKRKDLGQSLDPKLLAPAGYSDNGATQTKNQTKGTLDELDLEPQIADLIVSEAEARITPITLTRLSPLYHLLDVGPLLSSPGQQTQTITLRVSQLFDLSNALAECWPTLHPQPGLGQQAYRVWRKTPAWLQSTAVAIVIVGISTTLVPWLQPSSQFMTQESTSLSLPPDAALPPRPTLPQIPESNTQTNASEQIPPSELPAGITLRP